MIKKVWLAESKKTNRTALVEQTRQIEMGTIGREGVFEPFEKELLGEMRNLIIEKGIPLAENIEDIVKGERSALQNYQMTGQ